MELPLRAQSDLEKRILDLIEPDAKALGLDIVRVRVMGARKPILQVMAERPDGAMNVDDCARLSRRLGPALDAADPITDEYTLEVSSPGIDRPLTRPGDFGRWIGHEARIELEMPADGRRRFHGVIVGEANGLAVLDLKDGGRAEIPLAVMSKARLVLTDALVAEARARGQVPDAAEDDFDAIEFDPDAGDQPAAGNDNDDDKT